MVKLCYMDAGSFILYRKTDDIYKDIAEDKIVIGLIKDELGGTIITKFVGLRAKTFSYLIDDRSKDKKAKGTQKCVMERKPKFENYKQLNLRIKKTSRKKSN